jgi:hypothetical protein
MPFTEEEKRAWHEAKRLREERPLPARQVERFAISVHWQQPFGINGGVITEDAALCDICLGD